MTSTEGSGLRPTRQRRAVTAALEGFGDFRSAQEIHEALRAGGDQVGLSTVYRTLQALAEAGDVDMIRADSSSGVPEAIYRRCSDTHHHHLVCRACGATVEVEGPTVERWTRSVAEQYGYAEISHTLEIFGTCPACR